MNGDWLASELPNYDACGAGISNQNGKLTCNGIKPRPAGTYVASCDEVSVRSDTLMARCKTVKQKMLWTSLKDFRKCKGDITNIDGHLKCEQMTSLEMGGAGLEGFQGLDQALSPDVAKTFANWQLQHDTWTFKDGAPENVVALAQTNDGLLWLGGPSGLYRFDGRQFEFFRSAFGEELLSTDISSLYAPATGGLWIGYLFGGTSFLDKGRLKNYGGDFAAKSGTILRMVQDKDGNVWAPSPTTGLWWFDHSHWQHIGTERNVPLKSALEAALDRGGNLWVGGEGMLLCLRRGSQ